MKIGNYQALELIYESDRTLVYRGRNIESGQAIIAKLMGHEYPSFNELVQFRNQYAIAKNLDILGIVKPYSLLRYKNGYALIMEDIGAISLAEYQRQLSVSLPQFWEIALSIAEILHHLHQNQIIHKDIKPANILIHPETKEIKLIDFSISSLLPKETQSLQTPNVLEGTLAYLSPEQTGRMNRGIDYRSDFYSLGVTFYELLTGKRPFEGQDPLELVHAHIAKIPPPIPEAQVPTPLANIVVKLMAKNAEERYQSALGLKQDLEKCRIEYEKTGTIKPFVLGERDRSDRFLIPEKLYGREIEVQMLLDAFERVASPKTPLGKEQVGKAEMILVAGYSGIGKTAVVNEVHKPITRQKGYFIKGKFDQFNRNIPFSAFVIAFRDLIGQLLGESDAELEKWKAKILEAMGENGQVLIDVIPELEHLIGEQPSIPELSGSAARDRFNLLFEKFIAVFTTLEHPLTLFLDDLQWADSASLNLLKVLMGENQTGALLLLGAYRDNEVFPAHPLMLTLAELEKQNATVSTITLTPLSVGHINQFVAETLTCLVELATPLTDLVYQKTKGNPFFTTQFLKGLHEDRLITFNRNLGYWECDLVKVRDAALTDNVVEFMARRLHKLPETTQKVLKLAACIGNQFDLDTLAIICETPSEEVAANLWSALREGLILPQSQAYKFFQGRQKDQDLVEGIIVGYRFLHDRVQQAAYSLIPKSEKIKTHYSIGQLLLNEQQRKQTEIEFEVVNQLNIGRSLIKEEEEKLTLAQLNLQASQKAQNTTAYVAAMNYSEIGIELLPESPWQDFYSLTIQLHEQVAESAYLCGDIEKMERKITILLDNTQETLDRVRTYDIKVQAYISQNQQLQAVQFLLPFLAELGIEFPENPSSSDFQEKLAEIKALLTEHSIEFLSNLPLARDRWFISVSNLLLRITPCCFQSAPSLFPLITFKLVELSIIYGNSSGSIWGYSCYGLILCSVVGEIKDGYEFGELAYNLQFKQEFKLAQTKTICIFNSLVSHWYVHLEQSLNGLEGYHRGLETGDLEFAGYSAYNYCAHKHTLGHNLESVIDEVYRYRDAIRKIRQEVALNYLNIQGQLTANLMGDTDLMGETKQPYELSGYFFCKEKMLPKLQATNDRLALCSIYLNSLILKYLFGHFTEALNDAITVEQYLDGVTGMIQVPAVNFYCSLAYLAAVKTLKDDNQSDYLESVAANQATLERWANFAPVNQLHRFCLVSAEQSTVMGNYIEAMELYDRAIAGARENRYIQDEALANELAAKFYLDWGKEKIACTYMQEAYYGYARWGAKAKIDDLEKRYPQLLSSILQRQQLGGTAKSKSATLTKGTVPNTNISTGELLDLASLMKASRSLSQEIELKGAITNFMEVIQENAGAETVALMLFKADTLMLTAHATKEEMSVIRIPVAQSNNLPLTLVNQVKNTGEHLVLDNAKEDNDYSRDDYIQKYQPHSVLCMPLIDRGQLRGILYLENNQASGAFTSDRIDILNLLCSQAAITLQNAQLYDREKQARNDLQQALTDLQQAQLQKENAEMANKAKSEFLANMSHELRTPLNSIIGFAQILCQDISLQAEQKKRLRIINRSGEHLLSLINNILEMSKIEAGQNPLQETDFDLHTVLQDLQDMFCLKVQKKGIEFVLERDPDIPQYIFADEGKLRQVLINLIGNGVKFTDIGEVILRAKVDKAPENNQAQLLKLEVEDTGPGIAAEELNKLFVPFEQTTTGHKIKQGNGLGLAITQKFINLMGGEITTTTTVDVGTCFQLSIPIRLSSSQNFPGKGGKGKAIALAPEQPEYRILVVDDQSDNRLLMLDLLKSKGFSVQAATDGREAIDIWKTWHPDLIWMDLQMPQMDGYEAVKKIREWESQLEPSAIATKIIALTASVFGQRESLLASGFNDYGFNDYMVKPFREEVILEKIGQCLKVEWIYEESGEGNGNKKVNSEDLSVTLKDMPSEWLAALHQASSELWGQKVKELIKDIPPEKAVLATQIQQFADNYQFDRIIELLNFS
ncbi:MAG: AAA family ATPase [Cyanobacteria bacterium P01_H01_bin.35]